MSRLQDLPKADILALPVDRLALVVLEHIRDVSIWNVHDLGNGLHVRGWDDEAIKAVQEGLNWLIARGMVAHGLPGQSTPETLFISRLGQATLVNGPAQAVAADRLAVHLHPRLERVRSQFLIGEYELAAFAAMREVEIRVRDLAGAEDSLLGVKLMGQSFGTGGRLADPTLDGGEQVATMNLFAGAIGTFKNPPSHRQGDYADPTEASEVVMFADLLLRLLDRTEARIRPPDRPA